MSRKIFQFLTIFLIIGVIGTPYLTYADIGSKAIGAKADYLTASDRSDYKSGVIQPWTQDALKWALMQNKKVFIHFTGEGCLDCKVQWGLVDKEKGGNGEKWPFPLSCPHSTTALLK